MAYFDENGDLMPLEPSDAEVAFNNMLRGKEAKAVAGERARAIALCKQLQGVYAEQLGMSTGCKRCAEALEDGGEPSPPVPKPMTMGVVVNALRDSPLWADWVRFQHDLQELVKAQAQRDAEIAAKSTYMGGPVIARAILHAAGLE